jgi:hypothetical protein
MRVPRGHAVIRTARRRSSHPTGPVRSHAVTPPILEGGRGQPQPSRRKPSTQLNPPPIAGHGDSPGAPAMLDCFAAGNDGCPQPSQYIGPAAAGAPPQADAPVRAPDRPPSRRPGRSARPSRRRRAGPGSHRRPRRPSPDRSSNRSWRGPPRRGSRPSVRSAAAPG